MRRKLGETNGRIWGEELENKGPPKGEETEEGTSSQLRHGDGLVTQAETAVAHAVQEFVHEFGEIVQEIREFVPRLLWVDPHESPRSEDGRARSQGLSLIHI